MNNRRPLRGRADRPIAALVAALLIWTGAVPTPLLAQSPDTAPADAASSTAGPDLVAPSIRHEQAPPGVAGSPQRFEARVTDNVGIDSVTLFYRRAGESVFERIEMGDIGDDRYVASVPPDGEGAGTIEYFIEAVDLGGTRTVRALRREPLEPLERVLEPPPAAPVPSPEVATGPDAETVPSPEPEPRTAPLVLDVEPEERPEPAPAPEIVLAETPATEDAAPAGRNRTLWYVVGGVLLAGVIAAAAGGGGGGGGDDDVVSAGCDGTCTITFVIDPPR